MSYWYYTTYIQLKGIFQKNLWARTRCMIFLLNIRQLNALINSPKPVWNICLQHWWLFEMICYQNDISVREIFVLCSLSIAQYCPTSTVPIRSDKQPPPPPASVKCPCLWRLSLSLTRDISLWRRLLIWSLGHLGDQETSEILITF